VASDVKHHPEGITTAGRNLHCRIKIFPIFIPVN